MLYVFGDSWGYGSELIGNEKPFSYFLSIWLETEEKNLSKPGISLGHITSLVLNEVHNMNEDDSVVVIIPPDTRWYSIDEDFRFRSLSLNNKKHGESIANLSLPWFVYHHNLFIYTICNALLTKTKKIVLAHNYGNLIIIDSFRDLIDRNYFLSEKSLTKLLTNTDWEDNYSLEYDGPTTHEFTGKHFEGKITHPNQSGHVEIAKLLFKKLNS